MKAELTDQWPRTLFAWQRTLIGVAGVAVLMALLLAQAGHPVLALPVLAMATLPFPVALRRGRQLRAQQRTPSDPLTPLSLALVVVVLTAAGLFLTATL